ncbi:MAG: hypothetical protein KF729_16765 [Sandaracinaceae bacterium]|nr:hypothetical protein [Sandaracinaceae bacterium]
MIRVLCLAALAASTGCIGAPVDHEHDGVAVVPEGTQPLEEFESDAWQSAPRSCRDRLPEDVEFRLVGQSLVVAIDASGAPICTDEIADVEDELASSGRAEESRRLRESYLLSVGLAVPVRWGDPSPQPSTEACKVRAASDGHGRVRDGNTLAADPSPQPSTQPREQCRTEMPALP